MKAIIKRAFRDRYTGKYYSLNSEQDFEQARFDELLAKNYIEGVPDPEPEEKPEKVTKKSASEKVQINKPPSKKRIKKPGS